MNVFLTGASGYVGHHCMHELLDAGHTVSALSRRDTNPAIDGVTWIKGSLETLNTNQFAASEVIIHCAMGYENGAEASDVDDAAMKILRASGKFVVTTGNMYTCSTDPSGHFDEALETAPANWRNVAEQKLLDIAAGGASIRLGFVYGGTGGYFWMVFAPDEDGNVLYCGDNNSWPMAHVSDVARLFRLVAEQRATGIFHAFDGQATPVETMVKIASTHQGGTPKKVAHKVAHARLGAFANHMMRTIQPKAGNTAALGWLPEHPSFEGAAAEAFRDYKAHQQA